ncbi:HIT family protein [Guptibacillus algicola]|uniref:HIT family protein n=1 Tax=Guptibacillus algicola TaxID=225844 RepID=UPI001CD3AB7A|nr:HIT family protein [Alkalihalobacillus algicola]MCA0986922.1 HIT family protein [Alkalihalobacillus algicola]
MICLGCRLANKKEPVHIVYENDFVSCLLDHEPYNEGHVMILPKKHFHDVDEFDEDTATAVMKASILLSKAVKNVYAPDGITVCQNGGIFNELTHYHMHVVPRYENQSFSTFYIEDGEVCIEDEAKLAETKRKLSGAIAELVEIHQ